MATIRKKNEGSSSSVILLGKYEQGKVLGQGTFAKVYHAKNVETGESVAIKVLDKEKMIKGGFMSHIKREISILRCVRHPNIVRLLEVMATKSKILLVMEYIRGGQLLKKVAKGRLKEDVARKYFQQLISAVGFCHARGVYHRDLKPENLLLDEKGDLKVSDFGLSAVSDQIQKDGLFHTFCGTPAYVAPEVLTRKGYDGAKVDVWSCGVILFVLMAGYLPFHDPNLMTMYRKIYKGQFRCPRWFSPDLVKLLLRLLDTNPETRITIPQVMENNWFKKHVIDSEKSEPSTDVASLPRPASLNAFDIISFSPGFDLSGLFDNEKGDSSRFVSGAPVSLIISKLEEIAKVVNFTVRIKDCRVSLEGSKEGGKEPLTLQAQVFELTPSLSVVEIIKQGGDKGDYEQFYHTELSPGLENIAITKTHTCSSLEFAHVSSNLLSDTE